MQGKRAVYTLSIRIPRTDRPRTITTRRKKEDKRKTGGRQKMSEQLMPINKQPDSPTPSNTGSARSFHRDTERRIKVLRYCNVLQRS